ncbi:cell division protein Fic [Xenorhabdus vietnamensis]|uniref:Cell division protein Fic n=1 Tax=Xenorhabdus vietnamensis TaxID=351656 RepID=A0A1Y2SHG8_9GAMM|nr:cell division protein Fic [Xenorhabdus vietnamensis]
MGISLRDMPIFYLHLPAIFHGWHRVDQSQLSQEQIQEQIKVLNSMLDGDFQQGINNSQYQKIAKVSRATASRHLKHLIGSV